MRTEQQSANLDRLIEYYRGRPGVPNWGYGECAAAVVWRLLDLPQARADSDLVDAIGINYEDARIIIAGPRWGNPLYRDPVALRDRAIAVLEDVKAGKTPVWEGPTPDWGTPKI